MILYDWQERRYDQSPDVHSFQTSGPVHIRHHLNMIISCQKLIRIIAITSSKMNSKDDFIFHLSDPVLN